MQIITGCTILRDSKGNPGEMILHRREADAAETEAYCRKFYTVAAKVDRAVRRAELRKELEALKASCAPREDEHEGSEG